MKGKKDGCHHVARGSLLLSMANDVGGNYDLWTIAKRKKEEQEAAARRVVWFLLLFFSRIVWWRRWGNSQTVVVWLFSQTCIGQQAGDEEQNPSRGSDTISGKQWLNEWKKEGRSVRMKTGMVWNRDSGRLKSGFSYTPPPSTTQCINRDLAVEFNSRRIRRMAEGMAILPSPKERQSSETRSCDIRDSSSLRSLQKVHSLNHVLEF